MADSAMIQSETAHPATQSHTTVRRGDVVGGRYALTREIARGGMGVVFEARHQLTGRSVALKFVPWDAPDLQVGRKRLLQEARVLGALRHPNVVEIFDAGSCATVGPYLAMEMLEGRTLDGILAARRTLRVDEVAHIVQSVGEGLMHAHRRGYVHRDVKPSNVFVMRPQLGDQPIRLIDFGIAGPIDRRPNDDRPGRITRAGDILGTLDYIAPEQLAQADIADPKADQYALATVAYECLAGSVPAISDRLAGQIPDLAAVPRCVARAIAKAMSPRSEDRFDGVEQFLHALTADLPPATAKKPHLPPIVPPRGEQGSRRRFARAPYIAPCRVIREDGSFIDGRSEDISEGGLLLVVGQTVNGTEAPTTPAEIVKVRFALPTTGVVASVSATVRWVKDGRGRAAMGVEFVGPEFAVRTSIATYVALVGGS